MPVTPPELLHHTSLVENFWFGESQPQPVLAILLWNSGADLAEESQSSPG